MFLAFCVEEPSIAKTVVALNDLNSSAGTSKLKETSLVVSTTSGTFTYPPEVIFERPSRGVREESLTIHGKHYEATWARRVIRSIAAVNAFQSLAINLNQIPHDQLLLPNAQSTRGSIPFQYCGPPICNGGGQLAWFSTSGDPAYYENSWGLPAGFYDPSIGGGCFFNFLCGNITGTFLVVFPDATCDENLNTGFFSCNWNQIAYSPPPNPKNLFLTGQHNRYMMLTRFRGGLLI